MEGSFAAGVEGREAVEGECRVIERVERTRGNFGSHCELWLM